MDPEEKKAKAKDVKRKGAAVIAAEPVTKRGRDQPESSKSSQPFCAFQNLHSHNTSDYAKSGLRPLVYIHTEGI